MKKPHKLTEFLAKKRLLITRILCLAVALEFIINYQERIQHLLTNPAGIIISIILIALGSFIRSWSAGIIQKGNRLVQEGPYCYKSQSVIHRQRFNFNRICFIPE